MTPAGDIEITLEHSGGKVREARIRSTRPVTASKVLHGKTPQQVSRMVPLLFSLCGNAQAYAALLACRAALGLPDEPESDATRAHLVRLETLREHLWRIWLDWPRLLGREPNTAAVSELLQLARQLTSTLFESGDAFEWHRPSNFDHARWSTLMAGVSELIDGELFDGGMSRFLEIADDSQCRDWLGSNTSLAAALLTAIHCNAWQSLGANDVAHLPALTASNWHAALRHVDLETFVREPSWQEQCRESTPLSRQRNTPLVAELLGRYGNGLLARFVALLEEVAQIAAGMARIAEGQAHGDNGVGIAQVQAARGLLQHRVELRRGCVYDYRIVAPTAWNFHPDGVLTRGLKNLRAADADDLQRQAQWLIHAVDPCVPYRLNLKPE